MTYTFNENCIDCTECADKCAAGAIIIRRENEHTRCEVDPDLCVSCGHCANICEKEAVLDQYGRAAKKTPKSKWKSPSIDLAKCSGCMLCIEVCPTYALALSKPRLQSEAHTFAFLSETESCMGCGMCADRCPIDAITMV